MVAYKTFLGQRVWQTPILKVYYPFFFTAPMAYFLFAAAHTGMMNDPENKWNDIVKNAKEGTENQKIFNEASDYYLKHK
ncbi:hypothetical protein HK098_001050 [Nowakowskiella sp. JEL0407]|nr:hypothetical protein HK098_001050 [Nowakowskiella sp. JEL0407]